MLQKFGQNRNPLAAVLLDWSREDSRDFLPYFCRARITGTPHGIKSVLDRIEPVVLGLLAGGTLLIPLRHTTSSM